MFPIYALFTLYTFFYVKKVSSTIILFQRHFFFGNPDKLISYYIDIKKLQRNYLYSFNLWRASNTINKNDGVTQKTAYTLVRKILYRLFSMWNRLEKCRNVLFHRIVEKIYRRMSISLSSIRYFNIQWQKMLTQNHCCVWCSKISFRATSHR